MKKHTALVLFIVVFVLGIFLAPWIGVSWDEPDNVASAGVYLNFFTKGNFLASAWADRIYPLDTNLSHLPPVHNYIGLLLEVLGERLGISMTSQHIFVAFHSTTAIFFALLVATVFRFGMLLGLSYSLSLFAALTTFFCPTLFGYGFSNIKDTAQAAMFVVALYYLTKKNFWTGSVVWGLAMATKFNAIYVPIIWGVVFVRGISGIKKVGLMLAVGIATMFLVWPYLWFDPIDRVVEVIRYFTSVGVGYAFFWNGQLFRAGIGRSLWWYPWAYLFVSTPIPLIILGIIGMIRVLREKGKRLVLVIWLIVPTLRAVLPTAALYDGLRHFVEILPAFVLLSSVGLGALGKWAKFAGVLVVIYILFINATYFPYSSGYYNVLVRNPNITFDRDIEGLSMKESMDWLHAHYQRVRVWAPIAGHLAWYLIRTGDTYVYTSLEADSIVLINKSSHISKSVFEREVGPSFALAHTIRRGPAILAWIYRKQ